MKILVLNCGSSSIKYQLLNVEGEKESTLLAKGLVERIGLSEGRLVHKPVGKENFVLVQPIMDHTVGTNLVLSALTDSEHGVISDISEIAAAGHRVAHGGEYFTDSSLIDDKAKEEIAACIELAPLHNPAALKGILSMEELLPSIPQVAVFDTSFHATMPKRNYMYALPYKYYEENRIRRYGFHGTSHKFVAKRACELCGLDYKTSKIITCHIGNGASVTAIENGKSIMTSMGFTPVDGLVMGTRTGEIDPGALLYIMDKEGLNTEQMSNLINKESGMLGVSCASSDMRDIVDEGASGNEKAQLVMDMFCSRLRRYVGAYFAELSGADLIVFTGGIGENEEFVREDVLKGLESMGIEFDADLNALAMNGNDGIVTKPSSRVKAAVICTDEELVIATDTYRLVNGKC